MKQVVFIVFSFFLFGCASYVQVMEVSSNSDKITLLPEFKHSYVYENDSIALIYSFWAERGIVSFSIYNKMDEPIYVDWKKCSYVSNGNKFDYWSETKIVDAEAYFASKKLNVSVPAVFGGIVSRQVITTKERITFIPPKSYYYRGDFVVSNAHIVLTSYKETNVEDLNGKPIPARTMSFDSQTSTRKFRNYITWSTKDNFEKEIYIDNEFYVSKVIEVRYGDFYNDFDYDTNERSCDFERNDRYYVERGSR